MWWHVPIFSALWRLRQKNHEFDTGLGT
jgi:hypothetical protein